MTSTEVSPGGAPGVASSEALGGGTSTLASSLTSSFRGGSVAITGSALVTFPISSSLNLGGSFLISGVWIGGSVTACLPSAPSSISISGELFLTFTSNSSSLGICGDLTYSSKSEGGCPTLSCFPQAESITEGVG
eukprot:CAMPEP_0170510276 /NCGR_PEP_ID=MMETSP0208-20121228/65679_1 /TAXON_ID=197538 /ORGANISM="Strombidium inclinatum, Strain S3" /LENGTH=134 /DNA_ID=CAMNT_0010793727 /DNA_START=545 /DNA_END=949 /DNA_ORIENTATION=+